MNDAPRPDRRHYPAQPAATRIAGPTDDCLPDCLHGRWQTHPRLTRHRASSGRLMEQCHLVVSRPLCRHARSHPSLLLAGGISRPSVNPNGSNIGNPPHPSRGHAPSEQPVWAARLLGYSIAAWRELRRKWQYVVANPRAGRIGRAFRGLAVSRGVERAPLVATPTEGGAHRSRCSIERRCSHPKAQSTNGARRRVPVQMFTKPWRDAQTQVLANGSLVQLRIEGRQALATVTVTGTNHWSHPRSL